MAEALDDRRQLSKQMNAHLDAALEAGERVLVVIPGASGSGIAGTDRRAFIWKHKKLLAVSYGDVSGLAFHSAPTRWVQLLGPGLDDRKPSFRNIGGHRAAIQGALGLTPDYQQAAVRQLQQLVGGRVDATYAAEQARLQQALPAPVAEQAAILCIECGAAIAVASRATELACPECGTGQLLRRCPSCARPSLYRESARSDIKCQGCGQSADFTAWRRLPVSAGVLASPVASAQPKVPDAKRRVVRGVAWAATGFSGLVRGTACHLQFGANGVEVIAALAGEGLRPIASVPWPEVRSLEVSGSGAITTTSGGGVIGGGFGAKGFVEGALAATAINALTRRTSTRIETFVNLNAGARELMLLNVDVTPDVLRVRLAPCFARLAAAKAGSAAHPTLPSVGDTGIAKRTVPTVPPPDRVTRLKMLADLRDSGALTEQEFQSEKSKLLASD